MHRKSCVAVMVLAYFSLVVLVGSARAGTVSFDGTSVPEDEGWESVGRFGSSERFLQDGWFVQSVDIDTSGGSPVGEQDFYKYSLSEFADVEGFFVEWRVQTDGPRSEINWVAPASFVLAGDRGIAFHFTIADDRVRFLRDLEDPIIWVDINPATPHTYRFEIYGDRLLRWILDGVEIVSGVPEGFWPTEDSRISWGARSWFEPSETRWDYIRFGVIPADGSGDYDSDGIITHNDFYFVQECLSNHRAGINGGPGNDAGPGCRFTDFDGDSDADLLDFAEFQNVFDGP